MSDPYAGSGGYGGDPYNQQQQPGYGYPQSGPNYPAAPPPGQPPAYYAPPGYMVPMQPSNGMGTASMVLGIIGLVCYVTVVMWWLGIVLGILAIIFGAVGRGKVKRGEATNKTAATSGLVCGIIATVLLPLMFFLFFASFLGLASSSV